MGGLHTPVKWGGMVLVDELIVGSGGDTIRGKLLHALQPHRTYLLFFRALCASCLEDLLLAILADAMHALRAAVAFFSCNFYRQSEKEPKILLPVTNSPTVVSVINKT
eukprot:scaffold619780_cov63-Attheya_sp.AAC.1